jgi:hypothetical protein
VARFLAVPIRLATAKLRELAVSGVTITETAGQLATADQNALPVAEEA